MSDIQELLDHSEAVTKMAGYQCDVDAEAIIVALRNTESERRHHEIQASTLRTDLEYMTRERDEARAKLAAYERWKGEADETARCLLFSPTYEPKVNFRDYSWSVKGSELIAALTAARAAGVAAERERCAKIAEDYDGDGMIGGMDMHLGNAILTRSDIAAAIRAEQANG